MITDRQEAEKRRLARGLSRTSGPGLSLPQRVTALGMLAVLVFGLNFHLVLLQAYGWSGMLLEYRETSQSWSQAAQQMIGGESPCNVCRKVEVAIFAGDDPAVQQSTAELSFFSCFFLLLPTSKRVVPSPISTTITISKVRVFLPLLTFSPDAPPPRLSVS